MRHLTITLIAALFLLPVVTRADLDMGDLPSTSTWYIHVNFKEMRKGGAGEGLYDWLDDEVFEEVHEDVGIDFDGEIDELTAYGAADAGPVILLQGPISKKSNEKILAAVTDENEVSKHSSGGKTYYHSGWENGHVRSGRIEIDSLEDGAYFSFALKNKIVVTASADQMEQMLANGGEIAGSKSHEDALFILSAERNLVQLGANAEQLSRKSDDWDSKILRNTRQLALLIADVGGKIAIDARLEVTEPSMVESIANIARGLIGLAAFSDDMDPNIAELLRSTKIDVRDNALKVSLAMDPDAFVSILDD